jgi:kinesin family member 2/24
MNGSPSGASLERTIQLKDKFINTIRTHAELVRNMSKPESPKTNVEVHVKVRPILAKEKQFQSVYCFENVTCLYYPSFQLLTDPGIDVHSYSFDGNHNDSIDHDTFFESSCQGVLNMIDVGGVGAIFAYGQTGSGKTYTISGVAERIVYSLPFLTSHVAITLLEVMGDIVRDLTTGHVVKVLVDSKGAPTIKGETIANVVQDDLEALNCIQKGFAARKTIGTLKNDTSSRSHFICRIKMKHRDTGVVSEVKLVDLAGSERNADKTNHNAERIKEASYINTSLMALKDCIRFRSKLSSADRIPFRSSKLTILLKGQHC